MKKRYIYIFQQVYIIIQKKLTKELIQGDKENG